MTNQMGLFSQDSIKNKNGPLALELRPKVLSDFYGQEKLKSHLRLFEKNQIPHIVFYGPPGTGKTTLAHIIAARSDYKLNSFNATTSGVAQLKRLINDAIKLKNFEGTKTIIFIDEIHRFNKAQQDVLLPHLENYDFTLLGATTEFPRVSLNKAILSRVRVMELKKHTESDLKKILTRATKEKKVLIEDNLVSELIDKISKNTDGDARAALNQLETLIHYGQKAQEKNIPLHKEEMLKLLSESTREYDKNSTRHYDVISAFIKSIRGSDTDSALLWLAIMLDGGEDPEFIARRLMISASEDIGNADPQALQLASNAHYVTKHIGLPEARIALSQATVYLCHAPKSNASYLAINKALSFVKENKTIEVPTHLRNHHPDKKNYKYPHSYPNHYIEQVYSKPKQAFYVSANQGVEVTMGENLRKIKSKNKRESKND